MSINRRGYYGLGGAGLGIDIDAIASFVDRWRGRVAEWHPDLTQRGFPSSELFRFAGGSQALVEPVGSTFADSLRHRTFATPATIATQAVVLRDANVDGSDGQQSISALTGGEIYTVLRWDVMAALQWGNVGFFSTPGNFVYPDLWTLNNLCGYGWTSVGTATPVADVEVMSRDASALSRLSAGAVRAVGTWQVLSVRLFPPSDPNGARVRVRAYNAQTGAETFDRTVATNIPTSGRLHAGIIASNGNGGAGVGRGAVGMSVAYWAVGLPS